MIWFRDMEEEKLFNNRHIIYILPVPHTFTFVCFGKKIVNTFLRYHYTTIESFKNSEQGCFRKLRTPIDPSCTKVN